MTDTTRGIGDNTQTVNWFEEERDRLLRDYAYLEDMVADLVAKADSISVVDSQEVKDIVTGLIKEMREAYKRVKGVHETEKAPHLERGRASDSVFFGLMEKISRGTKKQAAEGVADRLNRILTDYDVRLLAQEQERRRKEAEEAARKAREAAEAQAKLEREAEAARLAAERARKPELQEAKAEIAEQKAEQASAAVVEATVSYAQAEESYIATLATPADIMRQRTASGALATMGTEKFAEITDRVKLDLEKLRPYIPLDALEKAVRKYADGCGYSNDETCQISGARFGKRPKSRVL